MQKQTLGSFYRCRALVVGVHLPQPLFHATGKQLILHCNTHQIIIKELFPIQDAVILYAINNRCKSLCTSSERIKISPLVNRMDLTAINAQVVDGRNAGLCCVGGIRTT